MVYHDGEKIDLELLVAAYGGRLKDHSFINCHIALPPRPNPLSIEHCSFVRCFFDQTQFQEEQPFRISL